MEEEKNIKKLWERVAFVKGDLDLEYDKSKMIEKRAIVLFLLEVLIGIIIPVIICVNKRNLLTLQKNGEIFINLKNIIYVIYFLSYVFTLITTAKNFRLKNTEIEGVSLIDEVSLEKDEEEVVEYYMEKYLKLRDEIIAENKTKIVVLNRNYLIVSSLMIMLFIFFI